MSLSKNSKGLKRTVLISKVRDPGHNFGKYKCVGLERREASNGQFEQRESAEQPLDKSCDGNVDRENQPPQAEVGFSQSTEVTSVIVFVLKVSSKPECSI